MQGFCFFVLSFWKLLQKSLKVLKNNTFGLGISMNEWGWALKVSQNLKTVNTERFQPPEWPKNSRNNDYNFYLKPIFRTQQYCGLILSMAIWCCPGPKTLMCISLQSTKGTINNKGHCLQRSGQPSQNEMPVSREWNGKHLIAVPWAASQRETSHRCVCLSHCRFKGCLTTCWGNVCAL